MKKREVDRQYFSEYELAVEQMISEGGPVYDNDEKYLKRIRTEDDKAYNRETH